MLKRVNTELMRCTVGFSEKCIAVFKVKMFQINTEYDKKNFFSFQSFYAFLFEFRQASRIEIF